MATPAGLILHILELVQSVNVCPLSRGNIYEANGLGLVLAELGSILADGPTFARIGPKTGKLTARDRAETAIQPRFPAGVTKKLPGGTESHPWPPCRSWKWGRWNAVTRLTVFHL